MSLPRKQLPWAFRYLRALQQSGWIALMTGPEARLVLAMLSFADGEGVAYPGNDLLGKSIGTDARKILRIKKSLITKGMIERVTFGGGRGKVTKWRLVVPETVVTRTTDINEETVVEAATVCEINSGQIDHETVVNSDHKQWSPEPPEQYITEKEHHHAGDGGDFSEKKEADADVLRFLRETCHVNLNAKVRAGAVHFSLADAKSLWNTITTTRQPDKISGAMARAVMDADRSLLEAAGGSAEDSSDVHTPEFIAEVCRPCEDLGILRYKARGIIETEYRHARYGIDAMKILKEINGGNATPEKLALIDELIETCKPQALKAAQLEVEKRYARPRGSIAVD